MAKRLEDMTLEEYLRWEDERTHALAQEARRRSAFTPGVLRFLREARRREDEAVQRSGNGRRKA